MQDKYRDLSITLSLRDCLGPKKGTSISVRVAKLLRLISIYKKSSFNTSHVGFQSYLEKIKMRDRVQSHRIGGNRNRSLQSVKRRSKTIKTAFRLHIVTCNRQLFLLDFLFASVEMLFLTVFDLHSSSRRNKVRI